MELIISKNNSKKILYHNILLALFSISFIVVLIAVNMLLIYLEVNYIQPILLIIAIFGFIGLFYYRLSIGQPIVKDIHQMYQDQLINMSFAKLNKMIINNNDQRIIIKRLIVEIMLKNNFMDNSKLENIQLVGISECSVKELKFIYKDLSQKEKNNIDGNLLVLFYQFIIKQNQQNSLYSLGVRI